MAIPFSQAGGTKLLLWHFPLTAEAAQRALDNASPQPPIPLTAEAAHVAVLSEIASCASCAAMTYQMKIQPCAFWMEAIVDHIEAHRFLL
jgi:hypothetical protein